MFSQDSRVFFGTKKDVIIFHNGSGMDGKDTRTREMILLVISNEAKSVSFTFGICHPSRKNITRICLLTTDMSSCTVLHCYSVGFWPAQSGRPDLT